MSFAFRCPKCLSTSHYEILKDKRVYGESLDSRVFACRCGKQMFGEQIDEEFKRQKDSYQPPDEYELELERRATEEVEKQKARERQIADAYRKQEEDQRRKAAEEKARQEEENRRWAEKKQFYSGTLGVSYDAEVCAWKDCDNRARETSKYCSRDCSNKNARWRHRQKKAPA